MSNTQFAFIRKENVPGREAWQKSIDNLKFKIRLKIDQNLEPFGDEGFSPCSWGDTDEDVGFEIFYEPSKEISKGDEDLERIIGDNDYCIIMRWGGNVKDCAAAMIASCALAKDFGAVISYQGDLPDPIETLISKTNDIVVDTETEVGKKKKMGVMEFIDRFIPLGFIFTRLIRKLKV